MEEGEEEKKSSVTMGNLSSLDALENELAPADQAGLRKIRERFPTGHYYPMPPDGDCLYRSVAAGFLQAFFLQEEKRGYHMDCLLEALKEIDAHVKQQLDNPGIARELRQILTENGDYLRTHSHSVIEILVTAESSSDWLTLMQNPEIADFAIQFMRQLAAGFILARNIDPTNQYAQKAYFDRMTKTSDFGGEVEMIALSQALGVTLKVHNLENLGKGIPDDPYHTEFKSGKEQDTVISLLYRGTPLHHDLADLK